MTLWCPAPPLRSATDSGLAHSQEQVGSALPAKSFHIYNHVLYLPLLGPELFVPSSSEQG
jgi:hypothetical protein